MTGTLGELRKLRDRREQRRRAGREDALRMAELIPQAAEEGRSIRQIAFATGLSPTQVHRILHAPKSVPTRNADHSESHAA